MSEGIRWILGILDAIRRWFTEPPVEKYRRIADALNEAAPDFIQTALTDSYRRLQGAIIGLADDRLIPLLAVIVTVIAVLTVLSESAAKWVKGLAKALGSYLLFLVILSIVLSFGLQASEGLKQMVFALANGEPSNVASTISQIFGNLSILGGIEYHIAILFLQLGSMLMELELEIFKYVALVLLVFYPLFVLIYPFSTKFRSVLHSMHASFITIFLAPPVMSFLILVPRMLTYWGIGPTGTGAATAIVICTVLAAIAPFVIWGYTRKTSVEVVGKITAVVTGKVESNVKGEVEANVKNEPGPIRSFVTTALVGSSTLVLASGGNQNSFAEGIRRVGADAAAAAAATAGHPAAAAVIQGFDAARRKQVDAKKESPPQAGNATPPPPATAPPGPPTAPQPPAPVAPPAAPPPMALPTLKLPPPLLPPPAPPRD